jgi:hypothetical protein
MPITFDSNSPIPDEFDPNAGQPQKPQPKPQATKPRPNTQATTKEQYGPGAAVQLTGVAKWVEENIGIPAQDIIDNVFQGDQKTPDQIAKERGNLRTVNRERSAAVKEQQKTDVSLGLSKWSSDVGAPIDELSRSIFGGGADLVTGVLNLPTQVVQGATGKPLYKPINQGLVPENNTTAGEGLRTLSRYVWASRIPVPGLSGATGLGVKAAGQRAAEGFVQDFAAADGSGKDDTLIGNIPGLRGLQTNEAYNPVANRALIGLEGALFNAGVPYLIPGLKKAVAWWKACRREWQSVALAHNAECTSRFVGARAGILLPKACRPDSD